MPSFTHWIFDGFQSWYDFKVFLERLTDISHDALHVIVGSLLWVIFAIILRRPLTSWVPFVGTLAVLTINESVDLWVELWPEPAMQLGEAAKDVATTLAIPLALTVALRLVPSLSTGRKGPKRRR